ncbi:MAG: LPS export ABC transporter periplasmic protein LptC [Bacteroidales bacterium]|jgi:LPS export ABC transporter protein LptC|nr:LPS export ABC transporter periplasmic protein LptC [Bacteroidales bacterium]MBQ4026664.1 LPS export ABC transporter periplasmic protein LptC [Bacteroidales bacterium]
MMLASVFALASIVVSCKSKLAQADMLDLSVTPVQTLTDMFTVQTRNGKVEMRIEAPLMETYESDTVKLDLFPKGLSVYSYNDEGLLESLVFSDKASHKVDKTRKTEDIWSAFGNVLIHNVIKRETMETDTIYWDQYNKEIWTDCYVKMYSPDGFLQGYGMRSDDHARNAILRKTFNGYGVTIQDSTLVVIDSVNFIGAFPKN